MVARNCRTKLFPFFHNICSVFPVLKEIKKGSYLDTDIFSDIILTLIVNYILRLMQQHNFVVVVLNESACGQDLLPVVNMSMFYCK